MKFRFIRAGTIRPEWREYRVDYGQHVLGFVRWDRRSDTWGWYVYDGTALSEKWGWGDKFRRREEAANYLYNKHFIDRL